MTSLKLNDLLKALSSNTTALGARPSAYELEWGLTLALKGGGAEGLGEGAGGREHSLEQWLLLKP